MPFEALAGWRQVGERVKLAREAMGLTQAALGEQIGLRRDAITKIEQGSRQLSALELANVARATELNLAWFVTDQPALVVSRRGHGEGNHLPTDLRVGKLKREVEQLLELKLLQPKASRQQLDLPSNFEEAAQAALIVRQDVGFPEGPVDVALAADRLGLYLYALPLPEDASSGASAAVDEQIGVALVKGNDPHRRQRFTAAHEIGHHVFQDAYQPGPFGSQVEQIINSFAADLLIPRDEARQRWSQLVNDLGGKRQAAIAIATEYQVSWSSLCPHLQNAGLIDQEEWQQLDEHQPSHGDYAALGDGAALAPDIRAPRVPMSIREAVLRGYRKYLLGESQALDMLYGTLSPSDLPEREMIRSGALKAELIDA